MTKHCAVRINLALIVLVVCFLGQPRPAHADGRWRHITAPPDADPNKSLRSNDILALAYEELGAPGDSCLWVGTDRGLQSYNGLTWHDATKAATGLDEKPITALALDSQDNLWVGTETGVSRRSADGVWMQFLSSSKEPFAVTAFAPDGQGDAYVGTKKQGVWRCHDTTCQPVPVASQLLDKGAVKSLLWRQDTLWIGTPEGLIHLDLTGNTATDTLNGYLVNQIVLDDQNRLWLGTDAGIYRRDLESAGQWVHIPEPGFLFGLAIDQDGVMWAARSDAVVKAEMSSLSAAHPAGDWHEIYNSVLHNVHILLAAPDGMLWVGSEAGLSGLDKSWTSFYSADLLPSTESVFIQVRSLVRHPDTNELWAGTNRGVFYYRPGDKRWELLWQIDAAPSGTLVHALWLDTEHAMLWIGAASGVYRYNLDARVLDHTWTTDDGLLSNDVRALLQDARSGEIWAACYGGVSSYRSETGRWHTVGAFSGGIDETQLVLSMAQDETTGDAWAGTGNGVWQYDPQQERWVSLGNSLDMAERVFVYALAWDPQGRNLWFGTNDQLYGYHTADRLTYQPIKFEGWSQGHKVSALLIDPDNNAVWAGTVNGLAHYDPERNRWDRTWNTEKDGLSNNDVVSLARGATPNELWVGTSDGVNRFHPRGPLPWVRLSRAIAHDQDRLLDNQVLLNLNSGRSVELLLQGGSFIAGASELRYGYQLVGYDQSEYWIGVDEQPLVKYTDLKYGTYSLKLWAQDSDGRKSEVQSYDVRVSFLPGNVTGLTVSIGSIVILIAIIVAAAFLLRNYSSYAVSWGAAHGHPVQQLIPLLAPLREPLDAANVQVALQQRQAFTTPGQVSNALDALLKGRILRLAPGGGYRFISPVSVWLHRVQNMRRADSLAESVRSSHPLYAGARTFFTRADFRVVESTPEAFILVPGKTHPQADYRSIYTRLIAGRAPAGDDFEAVAEAARKEYQDEVEHRLAFVVSNRRPTPGARFRLYEIRQRWGLAIVHIDSELFGQVKPNMPAGDILTAQIDQSTGQQNLYKISSPVSDDLSFFGRETVLQQLIDLVNAGQPVGIFGLRKTGKTSLTQRLRGRLAAQRVIAAVDTQGTAREQGVLPLYSTIIGAFVSHIKQYRGGLARTMPQLNLWPPPKGRTLLPNIMRVFATDLVALHRHIGGDERLLLILDEVDRLLPAGDDPGYEGFTSFLGQLRAANQNLQILDFIVIGVDPSVNRRDMWQERDNELYQALHEIWMPPMDADNAAEMIESIGFQMGIRYDPPALQKLIAAGGGQPFVTRQICGETVESLYGQGPVTISAEQADLGIEEFVFLPESYLTELWRVRLDKAGRAILVRLAQTDKPVPRTALLPAQHRQQQLATLGALQERMLIRRRDGGYVIGLGALRSWIRWIELGLDD